MPINHLSSVDELLADGLIQAVMQADHVEPAELRTLLSGVVARIARRRQNERKALRFFATPRLEWRPSVGDANRLPLAPPPPIAEGCSAGLCC
jgi:hypothetical protein